MTSGLRSVRDKAIIYFRELIDGSAEYNKLYKAVNTFGEQVRQVAEEDRAPLERSVFKFNLNTIIGGQLKDDEHKLFLSILKVIGWSLIKDHLRRRPV